MQVAPAGGRALDHDGPEGGPLRRLVRWLLPVSAHEEMTARSVKGRVFVLAWLATIPFAMLMAAQYGLRGMAAQAVLNGSMVLVGVVALLAARRQLVPLDVLINGSLGAGAVAYALGSLAQTPFDLSSVFFLPVTALVGGFALGSWRAAVAWLVVSLGLGLGALALGLNGWTYPDVDTTPAATIVGNFVYLMVLFTVVGIAANEVRLRSLRQLDAASRAKSAFLANMSHEIRTPMNGVLGLTEVMLTEPMPAHQRERLELIHRSGEVLVALINDALDLSRIEAGKMTIEQTEVDLNELVRDVHRLFLPVASQKDLALELSVGPGVPRGVLADPTRLRQALFNLVSNAVKFTRRGSVHISATLVDGRVRFEVSDTGVGISPEVIPRLGTAFLQADSSTTRTFGGTGLGLAVTKQLIALMGGAMDIRSRLGEGSTFGFELALEARELDRRPTAPALASGHRPGGLVLVVDDNPINLKVASTLVEKAGYRVQTASSGMAAVEAVTRTAFSLVLMDCHMPEMDGFEATRQIRSLGGDRGGVPIVALTASAHPEDVAACKSAGMDDCLAKPVSLRTLQDTLGRLGRGDGRPALH